MKQRLTTLLASKQWPIVAAVLAVLLHLPALDGGFQLDDHAHRAALTGTGVDGLDRSWWTMFDFVRADRPADRALLDSGILPWWTEDDLSIGFWRPVAGLTHAFDFRLWPDRPMVHHAHSLLWLGLATVLVGVLMRRWLDPPWVAGLATLVFAVDDHHYAMAGWISNRNALIGIVFGVAALLLHDRWRRDRRALDGVLAAGAFGLALLANEGAAAIGAFLVGHAVWLDRGTARERFASLVPAMAVGIVWLAARSALGYTVHGSGVYVDPLREPVAFLGAMVDHVPILLHGVWLFPGAELDMVLARSTVSPLWITGSLLTLLVVWLLVPTWRERPAARMLAIGTAAALVPVCATFPAGRLLAFTGIGAAALLALPVADLHRRYRVRHAIAVLLVGAHLVVGPLLIHVGLSQFGGMELALRDFAASLPNEPELAEQTVVVVQAPSAFLAGFCPMILREQQRPFARRMLVLTPGIDGVEVERLDEHTLAVRPAPPDHAEHLPVDPRRMLRRLDALVRATPFTPGETVETPDATITVTAVDNGAPTELTVRFHRPLDDPSYRWFGVRFWEYQPFEVPDIGESASLAPVFGAPL